jgi:hypothetical protein
MRTNSFAPGLTLLPHQRAFVDTVFLRDTRPVVVLNAVPGLGKSTALAAAAARLLMDQPEGRVLLLVPTPLRLQFEHVLRSAHVPVTNVDRFAYRELLDKAAGQEPWPKGSVVILSLDFAKQEDIADSLVHSEWDLLMVDEVHNARGERARLLVALLPKAKRAILATAVQATAIRDLAPDATIVQWLPNDIRDVSGNPIATFAVSEVTEHVFGLHETESRLRAVVAEPSPIANLPHGELMVNLLLRSLDSSPAAMERALRTLAERASRSAVVADEPEADESEHLAIENITDNREQITTFVERCLTLLEDVEHDSKLDAFRGLFQNIRATSPGAALVVCNFVSTVYYLVAELEQVGVPSLTLHGEMGFDERLNTLRSFSMQPGTMIGTAGALAAGFDLSTVKHLIFYDVPQRQDVLQNLLGRVNRIGRKDSLYVHVLLRGDDAQLHTAAGAIREALSTFGGTSSVR